MSLPPEPYGPEQAAPVIHALGVDGVLVSFGARLSEKANRAALAFSAAVSEAGLHGVAEVATSLASVYLRLDLGQTEQEKISAPLRALLGARDWFQADLPLGRRLWRVPAVFGTEIAPQLDEAAALAGLTPAEAVAEICSAPLRVQTIGFAPGQPYLGELPPHWDIPRQTGLTPQVPEGALAVAIRQMVLFSVNTPTGWRHLGQTAVRLFRPDAPEPFLLRPGDDVLFQPVTRAELENIRARDPQGGAIAERVG